MTKEKSTQYLVVDLHNIRCYNIRDVM